MISIPNADNYQSWLVDATEYPSVAGLRSRLIFFLRYALLAVSANNAQPWLFVVEEECIIVKYSKRKLLPVMDPFGRSLYIGIGAAIANIVVAANHFGYSVDIEYVFDDTIIAKLRVCESQKKDSLQEEMFSSITLMKTNRNKRLDLPIPRDVIKAVESIVAVHDMRHQLVEDERGKECLGSYVATSVMNVFSNPRSRKDLAGWVRTNYTRLFDGMPAFTKGIPDLPSIFVPTLLKYVDIGKLHARSARKMVTSAPTIIVLGSKGDTFREWVAIGQCLQQTALMATSRELAVGIFIGPVEFADLRNHVICNLGLHFSPQIFLSIGYCEKEVRHSPRHQLRHVLKDSN